MDHVIFALVHPRHPEHKTPLTPSVKPSDASPHADAKHELDRIALGQRLRRERKAHGLTLSEVAQRSGMALTTVSRAERGQIALSYEKFASLARSLQLDLASLFGEAPDEMRPMPVVTFKGEGQVYQGQSVQYEFLATSARGKSMNPMLCVVTARHFMGDDHFASHAGEEFIYVLEGKVQLRFQDGETFDLAKGDSIYFDSGRPHAYISNGPHPAKVIGVCC